MARSIYHKDCPSCAAVVEAEAKQCSCGYSFGAQQNDAILEEQAIQDEQLLKEYLDARITQAVSQLEVAQSALQSDPKNLDKANKLMHAFAEVRQLRSEQEAQSTKLAELSRALHTAHGEPLASLEPANDAPTSSQPTTEFRAAQAAKVENIMKAAGMDTKECPKCHAVLPQRAALCFCGHTFASHTSERRASTASSATTVILDPTTTRR